MYHFVVNFLHIDFEIFKNENENIIRTASSLQYHLLKYYFIIKIKI